MSNSTLAVIIAVLVGIFEVKCIRDYGIYPIPYLAMLFIAVSLICGAIEKS